MDIRYLDLGAGWESPIMRSSPLIRRVCEAIITSAKDMQCTFIFEPGRVIAGNAGILVTKVLISSRIKIRILWLLMQA